MTFGVNITVASSHAQAGDLSRQTLADTTTQATDNSSDAAPEGENFILMMEVQVFFYMIYSVIFLLGLFGNVLVMYAVYRNTALQTVTNYFILNLTLADILLCVLCIPFTPLYTFLQSWVFGKALCHLVTCAQGISIYISSLTLTTIAVDRFIAIVYPFRQRIQPSACFILIMCTWLLSIGATMPYAYFVEYIPIDDGKYVCQEHFPEDVRLTFGSITTVLQFVIPFIIMTVAYTLILFKLSRRIRSKPGSKSARKRQADRERKRRTNRMLIAMVAVFGLSWLPLNLMNIFDDISTNVGLGWNRWQYFHLLFFIAHSIAMSSTCYNPFLYAWLNETFRKEFGEILPCFRARCGGCAAPEEFSMRRNSTTRTAMEHEPSTTTVRFARATFDVASDNVKLQASTVAQPRESRKQTGAAEAGCPFTSASAV
ncbi:neuropeptide Y receptor type 2-like [Pollicipes pollicipes]|uniref:neuropeptide Y receptor type 2-like n=1 Tax=Pollicipes pollicipes TaxID=41117 RepID=UPI001884A905|nr:neuropeptide Y receptor type 2-like [Pollicipes pollicipes]XP_037069273.1 neuropeptide Y receptor type 2-like [Pollicipes pollicipes]